MAQLDKEVTLHHRDGRERVVTTTQEQVAAEFDGFAVKRDAPKPRASKPRTTKPRTAKPRATKAPTDTSAAAEVTDVS